MGHETHNRPPFWQGGIVGALLTPPLMAVLYLGEQFAGLPFAPLDFFSFLIQTLPGSLVTFGLDTMVNILIGLGFGENLDSVGKTAEQLLGLVTFWGIGIVAGLIFFALANRFKPGRTSYLPGLLFGLILAAPVMFISNEYNISATAPAAVQMLWLGLTLAGYGILTGWIYNVLSAPQAETGEKPKTDVEPLNRREFLVRLGASTATLTVIGAGLGALLSPSDDSQTVASRSTDGTDTAAETAPNADANVQPAPGTRPEITPVEDHYRIDIATGLPSIPDDYALPITGLIANEVEWSLDDIREMPSQSEYITMSCISNRIGGSLISTTKWTGVSFQHILEQLEPSDDAQALFITSFDGFDEYLPLEMIRNDERIMLAYAFDDEPLPLRNGFPLRIHIPNRYGMKQPKWIEKIEIVDESGEGYWVRRGWSAEAIANATSVVDTVATDAIYQNDAGDYLVPIGGIAWAGDRGISKVEVRVNEGEWTEARLREPLSGRAWVLWRYDWMFTEGATEFEVRCFDGDGEMQVLESSPVRPDGATGVHSMREFMRESILPEPETESDSA
jgi:DMSO/TMAO reductase YedYZ molybdopterin-dependent catalytic subunit